MPIKGARLSGFSSPAFVANPGSSTLNTDSEERNRKLDLRGVGPRSDGSSAGPTSAAYVCQTLRIIQARAKIRDLDPIDLSPECLVAFSRFSTHSRNCHDRACNRAARDGT